MQTTEITDAVPGWRISDDGHLQLEFHRDDDIFIIHYSPDEEYKLNMLDNLVPQMIAAREILEEHGYEATLLAFDLGDIEGDITVEDFE